MFPPLHIYHLAFGQMTFNLYVVALLLPLILFPSFLRALVWSIFNGKTNQVTEVGRSVHTIAELVNPSGFSTFMYCPHCYCLLLHWDIRCGDRQDKTCFSTGNSTNIRSNICQENQCTTLTPVQSDMRLGQFSLAKAVTLRTVALHLFLWPNSYLPI